MEQLTISMICPDCGQGVVLLVGSCLRWTRQCTECGITEVISYEKKRELVETEFS